jgi:NitT/TauT family transport system permease protein
MALRERAPQAAPLPRPLATWRPPATTGAPRPAAGRSRRRAGRAGGSLLAGCAGVAAGLAAWAALAATGAVAAYALPPPAAVAREAVTLAARGVLWQDVRATLDEALLGFGLAFAVAALAGYPLARSRLVASVLSPYVAGMQAMPVLALAPLLVVWFGLGLFARTLICAIIVFFPMLVNIAVGLRTVDRSLVEAAATEGAGRWATLVYVEVPLALPTILAGIRVGLTLSITGAVVSEFVASSAGLGYLMLAAQSQYNAAMLFVAALTIVALAVAGYLLVGWLERLLVDWT